MLYLICSFTGNTGSSVTGCTGNEVDKQIGIWERRVKGLRRLLLGWDQARPPDAPASVTVDVTGDNSIQVQILEPFDGAIGTKFKGKYTYSHISQSHTHIHTYIIKPIIYKTPETAVMVSSSVGPVRHLLGSRQ